MLEDLQKNNTNRTISTGSLDVEVSKEDEKQPPVEKKEAPRFLAFVETALIIVGLLAIFLFLKRDTGGDGWVRYQDLLTLLNHHIPHSGYSLVGPFFALPLLIIGKKLGASFWWICIYNQVLFAGALLIIYFLLRERVDGRLLRRFFLLLIVASMFTAHLAFFYGEVFTALCVGVGIIAVVMYTGVTAWAGWLAIILGVANTPASLVGLGLMMLKRMFEQKRFRYILALVAAGGLILTENWIRHGNPFATGYEGNHGATTVMPYSGLPGFSYPFFFGLLSILFSFGKGLLFFTPGLLLPIRKTLQRYHERGHLDMFRVYLFWICFLVGLILVYARWWAWYGGVFWGPRFFLIASLPASFALAVRLRYAQNASLLVNLLTLVIFCLSTWVGINGAIYQWNTVALPICGKNEFALEFLCHYTPEMSTLWWPFVSVIPLNSGQIIVLSYFLIVAAYLVFPLLRRIAQQLWNLWRSYGKNYLDLKAWRV